MMSDKFSSASVYVITCAKTQQRLPAILAELKGVNANLEIIRRFDIPQFPSHIFDSHLWNEHFVEIDSVQSENLRALGFSDSQIINSIAGDIRRRSLSPAEMSLSAKIVFALNAFLAQGADYAILVEDDLTRDPAKPSFSIAHELNKVIEFARSEKADLIDIGSLPIFDIKHAQNHRFVSANSHGAFSRTSRLMTRSTCCFLVSRDLVSAILKYKYIQSLPIDLHLQYLYELVRVEDVKSFNGFWLTSGVLLNGSMAEKKTGIQTSIQD